MQKAEALFLGLILFIAAAFSASAGAKGVRCAEEEMGMQFANLGDGSWWLVLDFVADDRGKLTRTATAYTALGTTDYSIKGSHKEKSGESKMKLTPLPGQGKSKIEIKDLRPGPELDLTPGALVKYQMNGFKGKATELFESE